jgi:hypothetical protein
MEREQYEEIRAFARSLSDKRALMADGQLLDLCQRHLDALVEHLADEFEEHPHEDNPKPAHIKDKAPKKRSHHKKVQHS